MALSKTLVTTVIVALSQLTAIAAVVGTFGSHDAPTDHLATLLERHYNWERTGSGHGENHGDNDHHDDHHIIKQLFRRQAIATSNASNTSSSNADAQFQALKSQHETKRKKLLKIRIAAIYVGESEFPLSESLFKATVNLAVSDMNKRLESANIKLVVNVRSASLCGRQFASAVAAEEYLQNRVRLFIISGCDEAIRSVSRMAKIWNVPILTPTGFDADLDNKRVYATLVRVAFSVQGAVEFLIKIFKSFHWRNINLIVDESDSNSLILKTSIQKHFKQFTATSQQVYNNSVQMLNDDNKNIANRNKSVDFYIELNDVKLDLDSLLAIETSSSSSLSSNMSTQTNKRQVADRWPNAATESAVRDALHQSALFSRINILLVPVIHLRRFMLTAYDMNMANGHYTFINIPLLAISTGAGDDEFLWRASASTRNAQARQAFESLMSIYLKTPTTKAYAYFVTKLIESANNKTVSLEVNPYLASFYDCFDIYATTLVDALAAIKAQQNITERQQMKHDLNAQVCARMRSRKFENLITGQVVTFSANADRETDYTLEDMNSLTGKFRPVILYKGETGAIERLARIQWSQDQNIGPSIDTADCELVGSCVNKLIKYLIKLVLIVTPVVLIASSLLYYLYRRISLESQLVDYWWRVKVNEVELLGMVSKTTIGDSSLSGVGAHGDHQGDASTHTSGSGAGAGAGAPTIAFTASQFAPSASGQQVSTAVASTEMEVCYGGIVLGSYKLAKVALKPISKFHLSRKLMVELRMMKAVNHQNLCRFVGIIAEEPNLAVLSEFCSKASLRQIFRAELMIIDWTFKYSIINDIVAGLVYLHASPIGFHGRLKASNCLVSSRFVVKLADYGLTSLYEQIDSQTEATNSDLLARKRLAVAPEHLKSSRRTRGSKKGDSYSFGLLLYEVFTGAVPFFDQETKDYTAPVTELLEQLKSGGLSGKLGDELEASLGASLTTETRDGLASGGSAPNGAIVANIMRQCWQLESDKRPTISALATSLKAVTKGVTSKKLLENLTQRMEQYNTNLESLVDAKLETLLEEKARTEELLYQFVPKSIAQMLKDGQPVEPEAFDCVTVFYSDIVGFTSLSAESTPIQVVDFLSQLYMAFDETLERYDIFKVETIGDAYIVASGLPERNGDRHASEIASAAVELRRRLRDFRLASKPKNRIEMRVGIHSGPCVAGVVGGVPKYCVFGETVLIGKFMESSGLPSKIQVTEQSKALLDSVGGYKMEPRTPKVTRDGLPFTSFWLEPV